MTKNLVVLFVLSIASAGFAGDVRAQTGSAAAAPAATEAPAPAAAPTPAPAGDARKACTDAMNADPQFAAAITKVADAQAAKQRDDDLLAAHTAADARIKNNEKHVVYAYAALWIIAAAFVIFLWRRQEVLKGEISSLRRDLEAAADDSKAAKGRA